MTIVKSLSVGNGDMFYIKHGSDNFSVIDCCLTNDNRDAIVEEIRRESASKEIRRFISTHADEDHIRGLDYFDDKLSIVNFYCVENSTTKEITTDAFLRYCQLRDSSKAFKIFKGCSRKWMNQGDADRGSAGISIEWPDPSNSLYQSALSDAADGKSPNNISPIVQYSIQDGARFLWMGDLESDFLDGIEKDLDLSKIDILFAPHHGRESGRVPSSMLQDLDPKIIVIGEALSKDLNYYSGYNTITQNSAGDLVFDCDEKLVHVYSSSDSYSVDFLTDYGHSDLHGIYLGSFEVSR